MENKDNNNLPSQGINAGQLSGQTIADFQKLYLHKTGTQLSDEEARRRVMDLLIFVKSIYKPVKTKDKNEN